MLVCGVPATVGYEPSSLKADLTIGDGSAWTYPPMTVMEMAHWSCNDGRCTVGAGVPPPTCSWLHNQD